jgi:hypothetical protein
VPSRKGVGYNRSGKARPHALKRDVAKDLAASHQAREEGARPVVSRDKIGRNDPCPCGSGKKHKKCCSDLVKSVDQSERVGALGDPQRCEHPEDALEPKHEEPWDDDKYTGLDAYEIKRRWPRQHCRLCGTCYYRSFTHYVAGDW